MSYRILFQKNAFDDETEYFWASPESRQFNVRDIGSINGECYFLEELIPNGVLTFDGTIDTRSALSQRVKELLERLSPADFFKNLPEGVTLDNLVCVGGGYGIGSRYYTSWTEVEQAILDVIKSDQWYRYHDPEVAAQIMDDRKASGEEQREKLTYWEEKLSLLTATPSGESTSFTGFANAFGTFKVDTRNALLSFLNAPSEETWDRVAHRILIGGTITGWQIWVSQDPTAPRGKPRDGWDAWPSPDDFREHLSDMLDIEIRKAKKRVREARMELETIA